MIQVEQLSIRRGNTLLFNGASLQIHSGQKVGLTGANGCGKSSLFAAFKNDIPLNNGAIHYPNHWQVAHVAQEAPSHQKSAIDHVLDGDPEWRYLDSRIQDTQAKDYLATHARYEEINGYTARSRAAQLLHGLGFSHQQHNQPCQQFSGGWRVRLNLAQALMCRSDLLLLDEPTNHLDLDAVLWLERWLQSYAGTLIIIAHDRDFLDQLTTHTLHIENQSLELYRGNYSAFEKIRTEQLAHQSSQYHKQQREIEHMQDFVRRFRAKATKAKQAQSRLKALERMETIAPAHVDSPFSFTIPTPEKQPSPLLSLTKINIGYNDQTIIKNINLAMSPGDRIGLIGPNGAGKSTLIKLIAGTLKASNGQFTGSFHQAKELNIGYFAQHQIEQLQLDHSPLEHLKIIDQQCNHSDSTENQLRRYLGSFGFSGTKSTQAVRPFSGGEKSRLALALICFRKPNLLLLDEPTNHLDLEMRQALAVALQEYEGAVILVSHDRHLLKVNSDTLILVANGQASEFQGSLDDYPKWLAEHNRKKKQIETDNISTNKDSLSASENKPLHNTTTAKSKKEKKHFEAQLRKQLQPYTKKIQQLEKEITKTNANIKQIDTILSDENIYQSDDKKRLQQLLQEQSQHNKKLTQLESDWLDANEQLEQIKQTLLE